MRAIHQVLTISLGSIFLLTAATGCYMARQGVAPSPAYVTTAERMVMNDPTAATGWINLGDAYKKAKRWDKAADAYTQALGLDPDNAAAKGRLAALGGNRPMSEAERYALENPTDDEAWGDAGDEYALLGQTDLALKYYLFALRIDPGDSEWQRKAIEMGGNDVVYELFETRLAAEPDNDELLGDMGDALREAGRIDEALQYYRRANELDPGDSEWINKIQELTGEYIGTSDGGDSIDYSALFGISSEGDLEGGAIAGLIGGSSTEGDDEAVGDRADERILAGDREGALQLYKQALLMDPDDSEWGLNVALYGGLDELAETLETAAEAHPENASVAGALGDVYAQQGDRARALTQFEKALKLEPSSDTWQGWVAMLGGLERTLAILQQQVPADETNDEMLGALADYQALTGQTDAALQNYEKGLAIDPEDSEWTKNIAILGGNAMLIELLESAVAANPSNDELVGNLGDLYAIQGNLPQAIECYTRASRLDSSDEEWARKLSIFKD